MHRWPSMAMSNDAMSSLRLPPVRGVAWGRFALLFVVLFSAPHFSKSLGIEERGGPKRADSAGGGGAPPRRLLAARRQLTTASCGGVSFTVPGDATFIRSCNNAAWDVFGDCHFNAGKDQSGNQYVGVSHCISVPFHLPSRSSLARLPVSQCVSIKLMCDVWYICAIFVSECVLHWGLGAASMPGRTRAVQTVTFRFLESGAVRIQALGRCWFSARSLPRTVLVHGAHGVRAPCRAVEAPKLGRST